MVKRLLRLSVLGLLNLLPANRAMRLLLGIDRWLYYFQGRTASRYGGGIHPKHRLMNYHAFFVSRVQSGMSVLDIGCGNGAVAYSVADQSGADVTGIDIDPRKIEIAQERHQHPRLTYLVGDATQTRFSEPVDVVILSNVLEHLKNRPTFLRTVVDAVTPSRLLIRVPLFERDWRVPLKKELGVEWRLDPTHEIEYTLETYAAEMDAAGLNIDHLEVRWGEIWSELSDGKGKG